MTSAFSSLDLRGTPFEREILEAGQRRRDEVQRHVALEKGTENKRHEAAIAKAEPVTLRALDAVRALQPRWDAAVATLVEAERAERVENQRHDSMIARLDRALRDASDPALSEFQAELRALDDNDRHLTPSSPEARQALIDRLQAIRAMVHEVEALKVEVGCDVPAAIARLRAAIPRLPTGMQQ
jgi:hypothetical protein